MIFFFMYLYLFASGSVTCYLQSKLFQRNSRTGCYSTEELWLPIKDITTTVAKSSPSNNNVSRKDMCSYVS